MKYRKIDCRIWNDEKFNSLSDKAKLIFFFLLTHPHMTPLGAMRATLPGLAAELGWDVKGFSKGFAEPFRKGMVKHNETAHFLSLPRFIYYNTPNNPNVVKAWVKCLDDIPECEEKNELIQDVKELLKGYSKPFQEPFEKGLPKGMRKQEQEQEQEISPLTPQGGNGKKFIPPAIEEVKAYCHERGGLVDPEHWWDWYQSKNWMVGKNKMKDWKAAIRTWEKKQQSENERPEYERLT